MLLMLCTTNLIVCGPSVFFLSLFCVTLICTRSGEQKHLTLITRTNYRDTSDRNMICWLWFAECITTRCLMTATHECESFDGGRLKPMTTYSSLANSSFCHKSKYCSDFWATQFIRPGLVTPQSIFYFVSSGLPTVYFTYEHFTSAGHCLYFTTLIWEWEIHMNIIQWTIVLFWFIQAYPMKREKIL